jgi:hypothetical protein
MNKSKISQTFPFFCSDLKMARFVQVTTEAGDEDFVPSSDIPINEDEPPELEDEKEKEWKAPDRPEPDEHPVVRELAARFASSGARTYTFVGDLGTEGDYDVADHYYLVFPEVNKLFPDPPAWSSSALITEDPVPGPNKVNQEDFYNVHAYWVSCTDITNLLRIVVRVFRRRS